MSVEIIHCETCGGSSIPLGSVCVDLKLTKSDWCDKCHNSSHHNQNHFFCSVDCFLDFAEKLASGKSILKYREWKNVDGVMKFE